MREDLGPHIYRGREGRKGRGKGDYVYQGCRITGTWEPGSHKILMYLYGDVEMYKFIYFIDNQSSKSRLAGFHKETSYMCIYKKK